MATLTVRNVPDGTRNWLRVRAAMAGRSMEAEVRAILEEKQSAETRKPLADLQKWTDELYGGNKPRNVVDEFIAERRREAQREMEE